MRPSPPSVSRSGEPRRRRLSELVALPRRSPLYPQLARALAAADEMHDLRSDLGLVPVRPTATTRQAGCYRMREGDPIDLRVSRRHDRVPLSFLHELGHLIDHQVAPEPRRFASTGHPALKEWRAAARRLESRAPMRAGRSHRRYFDSRRELWARSYAQTVLLRSSDSSLRAHLTALQRADDPFVWPEREFEPLACEVEAVFARLDLLKSLRLAA
ncbi:MAG: hypothetical protein H0T61_11685 [Actinobacteria bacterium]|nr:hypothetical protein [Actinomycetota bacterium]